MKHILFLILFTNISISYAQKHCGWADISIRTTKGKDTLRNQPYCISMRNGSLAEIRQIICHYGVCAVVSDVFFVNGVYFFIAQDKRGKNISGEIVVKANTFSEIYLSYDAYTSITFSIKIIK